MPDEEDTIIEEAYWKVTREAAIVARRSGNRTRFQVLVRDRGRQKFFINQWFGTEEAAREFLDKLQKEVRDLESTP